MASTRRKRTEAATAFNVLTQTALAEQANHVAATMAAHNALHQMAIIRSHTEGKAFKDISIDDCVESIRNAEGGEAKIQLGRLIQDETTLSSLVEQVPTNADYEALRDVAKRRDQALARTAGPLMRSLFGAGRDVLDNEAWIDKNKCPTCGHVHEHSLLDLIMDKLAEYQAVDDATSQLISEWASKPWWGLKGLETRFKTEAEAPLFAQTPVDSNHPPSETRVNAFWNWTKVLIDRANTEYLAQREARAEIERTLPASMVTATAAVEAARRLQTIWKELGELESQQAINSRQIAKIRRIKTFLDNAVTIFADAEATASKRRLAAVEPLCQTFFDSIIHQPVKPALIRPGGGEELVLQLAQFFGLTDVSAQALLSESFRNAFAVSVYLAAASLYGGAPRFVMLDDVTSSFDAGHQFHLMEVIRTKFGRPGLPDGPQVILLSHDTLLEKLFNRNNGQPGWKHQKLEGTARTAVLPQSNAVNRVKDATIRFLGAGQVEDAAPRVRQYLEHVLLDVIHKVKIPVPIDFALDDQSKQAGAAMMAIEVAVKLHEAAGDLVLEPAQRAGLQNYASSIMANFVAHYATGSTSAFSAASLLGVLRAIDDLADCFKYTDSSGVKRFYRSLSQR
jgi:hypothetical protein